MGSQADAVQHAVVLWRVPRRLLRPRPDSCSPVPSLRMQVLVPVAKGTADVPFAIRESFQIAFERGVGRLAAALGPWPRLLGCCWRARDQRHWPGLCPQCMASAHEALCFRLALSDGFAGRFSAPWARGPGLAARLLLAPGRRRHWPGPCPRQCVVASCCCRRLHPARSPYGGFPSVTSVTSSGGVPSRPRVRDLGDLAGLAGNGATAQGCARAIALSSFRRRGCAVAVVFSCAAAVLRLERPRSV